MDIKNIKALIKVLNESGLSALEIAESDSRIRLERTISVSYAAANQPMVAAEAVAAPPRAAEKTKGEIDFNNVSEFKAPLIGIFYSASSPVDKPFVEVGSRVKKGDVLCIIEAMKVMNEITADRDGEIVDICVQNGQVVEFSQVLFKIH